MANDFLREEFEKHMNSRACEKPTKEMLFELFNEGYKYAISTHKYAEQKFAQGEDIKVHFNTDPAPVFKKPWKK